jgi:hypothetical protein
MNTNYRFAFLFIVYLSIVFFPSLAFSQSNSNKADDDYYVYDVVDPKILEIDLDFNLEKYIKGGSTNVKKAKANLQTDLKYFNAPAITLRYGVIKNLEFQLLTGYTGVLTNGEISIITKKNRTITTKNDATGLNALGLGIKVGLLTNKKARPSVALTGIVTLPNVGKSLFTPNNPGVELDLNFYNLLSENMDFAYNVGTIWSGYKDDPNNAYTYIITPGYSFSDNFGVYVDLSGIVQKGYSSDNRIDLDLSYYFNDYITLDVYAGTSFNIKKFYFIGSTFTATVPF